ncbi:copper homeostasis protein CutC [Bacteroides sp.]|uniref:copper homeostasis protein CutC n=1 Tax=Bacteroides sp. TaxID=29523 RepID=UPI00260165A4|nr:copper homeostasis protein CutC [Bacteroides sp.]MDD3036726.1 copper homeostasis protein CutC [Bacteroides sp.]
MEKYQFEVCANSTESCLAAQAGGANRVELCAGIPEGGTTPSYGEISVARELLTTTRLNVIIRPRGGDFLYSPIEIKTMLIDIEMARKIGADGVVFGCLTTDGEIDIPAMQQLMKVSKGLSVTFHRAFDVCCNPQKALGQIIELGCNRILTSGQQPTAELGIPFLKELQIQAAGKITLLAGCGVNEKNISRIAQETGIKEFHFSARENIQSGMKYKNESVFMGGTVHIDEYERNVTTARRVTDTIQALYDLPINKE